MLTNIDCFASTIVVTFHIELPEALGLVINGVLCHIGLMLHVTQNILHLHFWNFIGMLISMGFCAPTIFVILHLALLELWPWLVNFYNSCVQEASWDLHHSCDRSSCISGSNMKLILICLDLWLFEYKWRAIVVTWSSSLSLFVLVKNCV